MRKVLSILVLLFLMAFTLPVHATSGDVIIGHDNLYDADGYNYGGKFWLSSTVSDTVCVRSWVTSSENVYGSVVPLTTLQPNEQHFVIGQFNSADTSKPWSVNVRAQWKSGTC